MSDVLLSIRDFCVDYITPEGPVRAVDNVSLDVKRGEIIGIAGESGSGKSTLAQAIMRILPPPAVISGGSVQFDGIDLLSLDDDGLREIRWKRMSMVFQSAMDALNPVITIGEQITDTLRAHDFGKPDECRDRAAHLLEMVGIDPGRLDDYAHQLSGGMRQRVGIALAIALHPDLLILDEPTTALDVIVEREILEQIRELQRELGFAVMFITHDLSRMLQFSDRVAIFYAARLAEVGPSKELKANPRHPYTQGLLKAFPTLHGDSVELSSIPGMPPRLSNPPEGCRFGPRCPLVEPRCAVAPQAIEVAKDHLVRCHLVGP